MQQPEITEKQSGFLSFDPITVVRDVLRRWYLIVILALIAGMGGYVYSDMRYEPIYTTSATFVVSIRSSTTTVYQNLTGAANLASVFSEVLNSSILRAEILEDVGISSFDGTITAEQVSDTNLLTLRVTADNPRTAFLVIESVIENHGVVSYQVMGNASMQVLRDPVVPTAPSNTNNAMDVAKRAALVTAVAVCLLLAVRSFTRDAVRSRREAEEKLDCHFLGSVRHEKKYKTIRAFLAHRKTSILITKPTTSFHFAESIRKLRHQVEARMGSKAKVLLVTSVLEDEGKSTISVNLGQSLAMKGKRVLLIDCDLRKPACYKLLGKYGNGCGTIDVIVGKYSMEESLSRDDASGMYVLLEHRAVPTSTNLVTSAGMAELVDKARQMFDYVILDMPPMSAAPDAEAVVELADKAMLVVRQNFALASQINSASRALSGPKKKLLGCVLNNERTSAFSGSGTYGSAYAYGGYGSYGKYGKYGSYGAYGAQTDLDSDESTNQ